MPPPAASAAAFCVLANFVVVGPGVTVTPDGAVEPMGMSELGTEKLLELCTPPPRTSRNGDHAGLVKKNTRSEQIGEGSLVGCEGAAAADAQRAVVNTSKFRCKSYPLIEVVLKRADPAVCGEGVDRPKR